MDSRGTSAGLNEHVTVDDLARFRAGALPAEETLRVGRHLAECRDCAAAARRSQESAPVAEGFRSALRDDGRGQPRAGRRWLQAAAAVAAIGVAAALLYRATSTAPAPSVSPHHTVRPPVAIRVDYGRSDWNALVGQALQSGRLAVPSDLADLRPSGGRVRSSGDVAVQTFDPEGVVVKSDRPRFSWTAVPQAVNYRVVVYRGGRQVMQSAELTGTGYVPERTLDRGVTYQWQVLVTKREGMMEAFPSPPAAPALFRVLAAAEAADLDEARRRFPNDALLAGTLEARAGLIDDARRDLGEAARQHPGDAAIARLRDSLPVP